MRCAISATGSEGELAECAVQSRAECHAESMRQQSQFQAFQYPGSLGEHPNSVAADPGVRMLFLLLFTVALVSDGWG